jgi:hypothetical protein
MLPKFIRVPTGNKEEILVNLNAVAKIEVLRDADPGSKIKEFKLVVGGNTYRVSPELGSKTFQYLDGVYRAAIKDD